MYSNYYFPTFRRYYIDIILQATQFYGDVIDVGGKKINKRGTFRPPINSVVSWKYINNDKSTCPDVLANAEYIPIKNETFDIAVMAEIIEHLENPEKVLIEINRILKKQGCLILTIPFLFSIHGDPNDYQRWLPKKIEIELDKAGFFIEQIEAMGSIFAVFYDWIHVSLGMASKNKYALKNRLIIKFVLPVLKRLFLLLDKHYIYKNKWITTGFFVLAKKCS